MRLICMAPTSAATISSMEIRLDTSARCFTREAVSASTQPPSRDSNAGISGMNTMHGR